MSYIRLYKYYGGKIRMVGILQNLIPEHKTMYELFGGSCALTLNHGYSEKMVVNERNRDIFSILEVIKDEKLSGQFIESLKEVGYGKARFCQAKEGLPLIKEQLEKTEEVEERDRLKVQKAVEVFVLITQSYNAMMKHFSNRCQNNGRYIESNLFNAMYAHDVMQRVSLLNKNAVSVLWKIRRDKEAFVFLDPPYLHDYRGKGADRAYGECEMSKGMHRRLLHAAVNADCKIMICGYRGKEGNAELYDGILGQSKKNEWRCYLLMDIHKPNRGGERAKEYVWVNYELPKTAGVVINTKEVIICKEQALPKNGNGGTIQPHRGAA